MRRFPIIDLLSTKRNVKSPSPMTDGSWRFNIGKGTVNKRPWLWTAGVLIILILILTVILNIFVYSSKAKIIEIANAHIADRLEIGHMLYLFPHTVLLTDVRIMERADSRSPGRPIRIPLAAAKFSIWDFVVKQNLIIRQISLTNPRVRDDDLRGFWERNSRQLIDLVLHLPRTDIRLAVGEAIFDLTRDPARPDGVSLNLDLVLKSDTFILRGTLRRDKFAYPSSAVGRPRRVAMGVPLEYDFKGILIDGGFLIDNLAVNRKNLYLKLWGSLQKMRLQLNGFAFVDTYPNEEYQSADLKWGDRLKIYLQDLRHASPGISLDDKDVYIIDMDGLADIAFPQVDIRHFRFNLNDMPASVRGKILLSESSSARLDVVFYPARSKFFKMQNIKRVQTTWKGTIEDGILKGRGGLNIYFDKEKSPNFPVERIGGRLEELAFFLDQHSRSVMRLGKGKIAMRLNGNTHRLDLEDVEVSLGVLDKKLKIFDVRSPFYGGSLQGRVWVTKGPSRSKVDSVFTLQDVDAGRLDDLLIHFARAEGRLSGRIGLTTQPHLMLNGELNMRDGRLKEFEFFKWLAETFDLPSLREVDFHQVSSSFSADVENLKFQDIFLKSDDLNIGGYFHLDRHNLVSSYLSLALSKRLLGESRKFRPILKIFDEDVPALVFDFQLSGQQDAMNFQWLPSDHKRKIQERIPDFIERHIERNIDEMIESAPSPQSP